MWSENSGTKVTANIYPIGKFPTHHAIFGRGGYKTVATLADRDAIPLDRLTVGSIVRVHADGTEYVVNSIPSTYDSDTATGKDCTWEVVKKGGIDENQLSSLAKLDQDGKVLESQSRAIIYKGHYVDNKTFSTVSGSSNHSPNDNAIYIDVDSNKIYSWNGDEFVRDGGDKLCWINVE